MKAERMGKISIIVPVYNAAVYLDRCIESIERQTFQDWELILIDDGSTDQSISICEIHAQRDKRIRVIHTENTGVSAARNRGIDEAEGEYLTFVDADDWVRKDILDVLFAFMGEETDVTGCEFTECSEWTNVIHEEPTYTQIFTGEEWTKEVLKGNTRCWSKLYRKKYIGTTRFKEGLSIGEDMLFLLELSQKGGNMVSLSYKGYFYYVNLQGAMHRQFDEKYMDQIVCWEEAYASVYEATKDIIDLAGEQVLVAIIQILDKLAADSCKKRMDNHKYIEMCRQKLIEYSKYSGEIKMAHRLKIRLFLSSPTLFFCINRMNKK